MFGTMLNEKLRKSDFLVIFNWFPFNILYSTFPRFNGNATSCIYITCLDQGWDTANLISTIGAFLMAIAVVILVNKCNYYNLLKMKRLEMIHGKMAVL